ncbi:hypothetical protein ACSAZK_05210 [Methanosarcina sp. Mfa9]
MLVFKGFPWGAREETEKLKNIKEKRRSEKQKKGKEEGKIN